MRKALQIVLCGFIFLLTAGVGHYENSINVASAITVKACNKCGRSQCCCPRPPRKSACRQCPKCLTDVCVLHAECVDEERKCFEVEQKLICIPKVSLPWRKCEKPCCGGCAANCRHQCAKTRAVRVLKTRKYECKVCKYSWKVYEPEILEQAAQPADQPALEPPVEVPRQSPYNDSQLYDPAGRDVPQAPVPQAPGSDDSARSLLQSFRRH